MKLDCLKIFKLWYGIALEKIFGIRLNDTEKVALLGEKNVSFF